MAKVQAARTPRKKVVSLVTPRVERALKEVLFLGLEPSADGKAGETAIAATLRVAREANRGQPREVTAFRRAMVELLRALVEAGEARS